MVDKEQFFIKLNSKYDQTKAKKPWNLEKIKEVVDILKSFQVKTWQKSGSELTRNEKYYGSKYDVLEMSGIAKVILKTKFVNCDNLVYVTPIEDFYDRIDEQHKATGHGGREKMLHNLKKKTNIPRTAVDVYIELCKICNIRKAAKKPRFGFGNGATKKPKDFNVKGQISIINFQSCQDDEFKYVLIYQDNSTKFLQIRPLITRNAADVASELLKIFLEQGAPAVLQSENGGDFSMDVKKEMLMLWPDCKIVAGRAKASCLGTKISQDIEKMIRIWMEENKSTNWSLGCYFVQWQKNTSLNRVVGCSPYKCLFEMDPQMGLRSSNLPSDVIDKISTEEDLEKINESHNISSKGDLSF